MAATIKDVAKKADVSVATVSLVIHNHQRISPETKKRVRKAISDLDYHPTRSARGLVSKRSGNIGFIVTNDHFSRSEPFYTKIFLGTEFQARESEYYVLLTTISSQFVEKDSLPRFILEKNIDGIILAGKIPTVLIKKLIKTNVPLVFVDYFPPDGNFPTIMIDNLSVGFIVTNHLILCGHKKVAFVGGDMDHPGIVERFQGYKMALERNGIKFDEKLVVTEASYLDRENGYKSAKFLFQKGRQPTAIFACNDAMAIGVLQYMKEIGLVVPEDVSLIGFDDVEADLSLDPPLTSIRVPKVDMGIESIKLLIDIINKRSVTPRKILMPVELVIRKSTCKLKN
jgi:LacI family transcriptional regulator